MQPISMAGLPAKRAHPVVNLSNQLPIMFLSAAPDVRIPEAQAASL
jgi:hypothetical protein